MNVGDNQFNYHQNLGEVDKALAQYRKDNPQNEAVKAHAQQIARTQYVTLPIFQNTPQASNPQQVKTATRLFPAKPLPPLPPRQAAPPSGYPALPKRMSPPQKNYITLPPRQAAPPSGYPALPKRMSPPTPNPSEGQYTILRPKEPPRMRSSSAPPAVKPIPQKRASSKTVLQRDPPLQVKSSTVSNFDKHGNVMGQGSEVITDNKNHMTPTELAEFALTKKRGGINASTLDAMKTTLQYHLDQAKETERDLTGSSGKVHNLAKKLNFVASRRTKKLQAGLDHLEKLSSPPPTAPAA